MKWTDEEDAKLAEMHADGVLYEAIAARMGRTASAIRNRVFFLRKAGKVQRRSPGPAKGVKRPKKAAAIPEDRALERVRRMEREAKRTTEAAWNELAAAQAEVRPA